MRRRLLLLTGLLLVTGGVTVAVTTAGDPAQSRRDRLPIEEYLLSHQQRDDMARAYERQVRRCMLGQGAEGFTLRHATPSRLDMLERRYGLTDADEAREHGYDLPADKRSSVPAEPRMTAEQRVMLSGDGTGKGPTGCAGAAVEALGGPSRPWQTPVAMKLQQASWKAARKEPRVVSAAGRWSECMRSHGYRFASPMDTPGKEKRDRTATRELASTDVKCNRSSGVVREWFAAEAAHQKVMIAREQEALTSEWDNAVRSMEKARTILAR